MVFGLHKGEIPAALGFELVEQSRSTSRNRTPETRTY